ncbi:Anaphase-promoting complex (APC), subunit 11 [Handroanthus impetiginosus]|uniref:RING-type E3 ubiquitin transferase n=1 Tax=Handroanthus impetiginosus TaxID=429701 RepID=A0A2G9H8T9_9LAMI|nr:Anaphase-promoting complex (APC), subunit 11 [Handroanthus impetiginosus]
MGLYSKILLFVFLNFFIINGENPCPVSSCGSSMLSIQHPFKLKDQIPTNNCTYFNLICSVSQSKIIVNLPHSGDFYLQNIDYTERLIQLYDPANCLLRKLTNFSLESSPFRANYHENYTFYVCPWDSQVFDSRIGYLSNSMNITVPTKELSRELMEGYGCRGIGSWRIPVSGPKEVDDGGFYDENSLILTWHENVCKDCKGNQQSGTCGIQRDSTCLHRMIRLGGQVSGNPRGPRPKPIAKIIAIALSMPALIIIGLSCCSVFCFHLMKMIGDKQEANPLAAPTTLASPPTTVGTPVPPLSITTNTGLDESKITACTEIVVLSENDEGIPSGNGNTCSICLENYCKIETIRIIRKCGHCFHDSCIQQWLGKNSTCPVCRTCLCDVAM